MFFYFFISYGLYSWQLMLVPVSYMYVATFVDVAATEIFPSISST